MNKLWIVVAALLLTLTAVVVYKVMPLLNPEVMQVAALDPDCDLRAGPCSSDLPGGGRITFSITPEDIPVVKPLTLDVRVEGVSASAVEIDFQGVDMNMGFNRPRLARQDNGHFSGGGMIPVCVRDAMEWEAKVLVTSDAGLVAAPYRFITVKPGVEVPRR